MDSSEGFDPPTQRQNEEGLRLIKAFGRIKNPEARRRIIEDAEKAALKEEQGR